jgi:hypothetical protein
VTVKEKAQIDMEDQFIEDPVLEDLLEKREDAKEGAAEYRKLDKDAKAHIKTAGITGKRRCGRFIINVTEGEARHVEFDTDGSQRIGISNAEAEKT